jgi:hypothetical protein
MNMTTTADDFGGTTWRPDKGEHPRTLEGEVLDIRVIEGSYDPYPLVELEDDNGCVWYFHAFRDVAQSELATCGPQVGDRISVAYKGIPPGKTYHLYRIRKAGASARIDWTQFGTETPVRPELPVDTRDLGGRQGDRQEQAQTVLGDTPPRDTKEEEEADAPF